MHEQLNLTGNPCRGLAFFPLVSCCNVHSISPSILRTLLAVVNEDAKLVPFLLLSIRVAILTSPALSLATHALPTRAPKLWLGTFRYYRDKRLHETFRVTTRKSLSKGF